jgi:DNA-directed RNA polymerase specialized sigma24 family protein
VTFEEYVAARGPALVRFATLLTGDNHRAEDLAQEALAKAYLSWRRIRRTDRPDVYVRRLLINAVQPRASRSSRRPGRPARSGNPGRGGAAHPYP